MNFCLRDARHCTKGNCFFFIQIRWYGSNTFKSCHSFTVCIFLSLRGTDTPQPPLLLSPSCIAPPSRYIYIFDFKVHFTSPKKPGKTPFMLSRLLFLHKMWALSENQLHPPTWLDCDQNDKSYTAKVCAPVTLSFLF